MPIIYILILVFLLSQLDLKRTSYGLNLNRTDLLRHLLFLKDCIGGRCLYCAWTSQSYVNKILLYYTHCYSYFSALRSTLMHWQTSFIIGMSIVCWLSFMTPFTCLNSSSNSFFILFFISYEIKPAPISEQTAAKREASLSVMSC